MSRLVYFDCASGASGDMLLGALVDLGLPLDDLRRELGKLGLPGYALESKRVHRSGLHATKVDVVVEQQGHAHGHATTMATTSIAASARSWGSSTRAASILR